MTGPYRELFIAISGASGALTGLLFVAMSVSPRQVLVSGPPVIQQVRAAAALLAFTNALIVCLFGLVPGTNVGYPAVVMGISGVAFTAAAIRSILSSPATPRQQWRQLGLVILLLVIFGTEIVAGSMVLVRPGDSGALQAISYALASSLIVGIARSWELVGERDTGILASLAVLTGRATHAGAAGSSPAGSSPAGSGPAGSGPAGSSPAGGRESDGAGGSAASG